MASELPDNTLQIGIIILAAGASARLGQPKQLLQFKGESLIQKVVKTALATPCRPIVVVLGAFYNEINFDIKKLESNEIIIVENKEWLQGMSTSVKVGLKTLLEIDKNVTDALFLLTDQPLLTMEHLLNMITVASCQIPAAPIVASFYNNRLGVPALLNRRYFDALLQLRGDQGARKVLECHQNEARAIPFPAGEFDIDTLEDYEFLIHHFQ